MLVIATICSRKKNASTMLLPAYERYLGEHIQKAKLIALQKNAPFYILSGLLGFIPAETQIDFYDYLLLDSKVDELVILVAKQIREASITEINLYTENNPNWQPYHRTIQDASLVTGVVCSIVHLT